MSIEDALRRKTTWEEIIVGVALVAAVGWFIAKAMQQSALSSQAANPGPGDVQNEGMNPWTTGAYIWPGMYDGSTPAGVPTDSTVAGFTPASLIIPPLSPITYPPVSQPFTAATPAAFSTGSNGSTTNCACPASGFVGAGSLGTQALTAYSAPSGQINFGPGFQAPAVKSPAPQSIVTPIVQAVKKLGEGIFTFAAPNTPKGITNTPSGIMGGPAGI